MKLKLILINTKSIVHKIVNFIYVFEKDLDIINTNR